MKAPTSKNFEQAKQAAQRIYKRVNFDGGNLQSYELSSLLQQTYDFLKIPYKPSSNDLKEYMKVLDANGDGAVSLEDLQTLAVQYLCGDGVLGGVGSSQVGNKYSESEYSSSSYQNIQNNDYSNYGVPSQNAQRSSKYENEGAQNQNYSSYNQYSSGSQYNDQYTNSANNPYGGYQDYAYNSKNTFSGSGIGGIANLQSSYNSYSESGVSQSTSQQYGSSKNMYSSNEPPINYTFSGQQQQSNQQQSFQQPPNQQYSQSPDHLASKHPTQPPTPQPQSKYTPTAQNYLTITRSLFTKYSNRQSNTITRDRVAQLLNETYSALGRKGYYPSEEDINVWMKLCDTNSDGHVEEAEYQYFVVRALERSGVQVNNA